MHTEILYVEDNPADVYLLREAVLKLNAGIRIVNVEDGEAALALLAGAEPPPCVIVLDLGLPKIDGTEVLRAVKSRPDLNAVPTVVFADTTARRYVQKKGHIPDLFLTKPLDLAGYATIAGQILALCQPSAICAS
jgi:CheY-like chemotaxis protein